MSMPCWKNASAAKMQQCAHMGRRFKGFARGSRGDRPSSIAGVKETTIAFALCAIRPREQADHSKLFHFYARRGH